MNRLACSLLALLLLPAASAQRLTTDGAPQTLDFLSEQFFSDVFFHFSPTAGTSTGFHQYDTELEDYSAANIQREIAALHAAETKIAAVPADALDAPVAADRDILLNSIRSTLLTLEVIRPWEKNPDTYSSGIAGSAFVLMSRNYAPPDTRLKAVDRPRGADAAGSARSPQEPQESAKDLHRDCTRTDRRVGQLLPERPAGGLHRCERPAHQGSLCEVERSRHRSAERIWPVDEDGPAAALERRFPLRHRHLPQEASLRRDGGYPARSPAPDRLRRPAEEPGRLRPGLPARSTQARRRRRFWRSSRRFTRRPASFSRPFRASSPD